MPDERFLMFSVKGVEIDYKGGPEQGSPYCRRVHTAEVAADVDPDV
ncbi:MAG: hypothetical protein P4L27_10010 [Ignavibacteriaceae bacterium]|nr:hypothetical protein [Ignavibacteriaceae bacterium]